MTRLQGGTLLGGRKAETALPPSLLPDLAYTPQVARETAHLYERVSRVIPPIEWPGFAPYIKAINDLKRVRNAVVIVQGGVHFMAETSKLLNPDKLVLIPDLRAGCSLAASITGADVRALREAYPGVPVVTYVNTSAEVKAESDICCTSSNAVRVVESLGAKRVIFIPDEYLAKWVATQTSVEIITWKGHCEVHERFTGEELRAYREADPGVKIIAHPECDQDVIKEADFTGSTSGMIKWVKDNQPSKVLLVTECSMSDNVAVEAPNVEFVRPCNLCPHMKRITLPKILDSLVFLKEEVTIDPAVAERARAAVERMINLNH